MTTKTAGTKSASDLPPPPELPQDPAPDPLTCPHICTARDQVLMASRGPRPQLLEDAINHAADWTARNAPQLYTMAQAASILMGIFRKGPKIG